MNETYKNISLVFEIRNSVNFLKRGLGELQSISAKNDFYDPVLIFLSSGLERLLKSMICLNFKEINHRFPDKKELLQGNNGHDITFLKQRVANFCIPIERPFASGDYQLITNDSLINSICDLLSSYAHIARYFNLDAILGYDQEIDAKNEWEKIESQVSKDFFGIDQYTELIQNPKGLEILINKSNEIIICKLEAFLRALSRQFIFGNFSQDSKLFQFEVEAFSDIEDDQLGKTNYNNGHPGINRL